MVNYKVQSMEKWMPIPSVTQPGMDSGYVHWAYELIELQTQQIIKNDLPSHEAKALCRHLNFGGGFDGWTPNFFLEKSEKKSVEHDELV